MAMPDDTARECGISGLRTAAGLHPVDLAQAMRFVEFEFVCQLRIEKTTFHFLNLEEAQNDGAQSARRQVLASPLSYFLEGGANVEVDLPDAGVRGLRRGCHPVARDSPVAPVSVHDQWAGRRFGLLKQVAGLRPGARRQRSTSAALPFGFCPCRVGAHPSGIDRRIF